MTEIIMDEVTLNKTILPKYWTDAHVAFCTMIQIQALQHIIYPTKSVLIDLDA